MKINKLNIKNYIIIFCTIASILGCDNVDFENTNISPNNPTANLTNGLLSEAQIGLGLKSTSVTPSLYVQHLAEIQYTNASRYATEQFDYTFFYTRYLQNLESIITLNTDPATVAEVSAYGSNNNQVAVATILKAYIYQYLTDRWGSVPYTQAIRPLEFDKPEFDTQETIYRSLFDIVDEAIALMDSGDGPVGDLIFGGNMNRWRQFANTLKMTMALRLSDVDASFAQTKFQEALSGGVISNVSENILFPFIKDDSNDNPWEDRYNGNRAPDYAVSDTFVDFLQDTDRNDPRLFKYADPIGDDETNTIYVGMEYGLTAPSTDRGTISFITENIANDGTAPGVIYTYAQVAFAKAEAALKGWITEDVETLYYEGIKASMDQWEVSQEDYDTYITQPKVVFNITNAQTLIAEQKWVALYMQPYEAWAEWRRLDIPVLSPAPEPIVGSEIPVRQGYAEDVLNTNGINLDAAISNQGLPSFNDLSTKLWWDVN
jgi:hypothetical protein